MKCETSTLSVGVVGARGYVGRELISLLDDHPALQTRAAVSRALAGRSVAAEYDAGPPSLKFTSTLAEHLPDLPDVVVLALPNGHAQRAVAEIEAAGATPRLIIDLSSDHRFDDSWTYAVPEVHADRLIGATRISNPGCYATAMQLALAPVVDRLVSTPSCFGVSGYSGAGTTPSEKNDVEALARGVLPYTPVGHTHEREVTRQLGHPVRFAPCVAAYPRGITLTALLDFEQPVSQEALVEAYTKHYTDQPFVSIFADRMPRVQDVVNSPRAIIGGFSVDAQDPTRAAVVGVIDNLLKGAASQAVQNINRALGLDAATGLAS